MKLGGVARRKFILAGPPGENEFWQRNRAKVNWPGENEFWRSGRAKINFGGAAR